MKDNELFTHSIAALAYVELGFAVFPDHGVRQADGVYVCDCKEGAACDSPGKHPIVELARRGSLDAVKTGFMVKEWWKKKPLANVALATGLKSGGVFVMDCDLGKGGVASLARMLSEKEGIDCSDIMAGLDLGWPEGDPYRRELYRRAGARLGPIAMTGSGGCHLFFQAHERIKNAVNGFAYAGFPGIDIRGEGGHVVAPPSLHVNGRRYEWIVAPAGFTEALERIK